MDSTVKFLDVPSLKLVKQDSKYNIVQGLWKQKYKFALHTPDGRQVGQLDEVEKFSGMVSRQLMFGSRSLQFRVCDADGKHVLTFKRSFGAVTSKIRCMTADGTKIGESHQEWHAWRRKYKLFSGPEMEVFGKINVPAMSYDFPVLNEENICIARLGRKWVGTRYEVFSTGAVYQLDFGPSDLHLSFGKRAVLLACLCSIHIDWFSAGSGADVAPGTWPSQDEARLQGENAAHQAAVNDFYNGKPRKLHQADVVLANSDLKSDKRDNDAIETVRMTEEEIVALRDEMMDREDRENGASRNT